MHLYTSACCWSVHLESVGSLSCFPLECCFARASLKVGGRRFHFTPNCRCCFWFASCFPPPFKMLHHEHLPVIKIFLKNVTWMAAWHLSSECPITVCVSDSNCVGLGWMASLKSRAVLGNQGSICNPQPQPREPSWPYNVCLDQEIEGEKVFEK